MTTNNWQPIETAPRDGTRILAWIPRGNNKHEVIWMGTLPSGRVRWLFSHGWISAGDFQPTHWMPLPAPPTKGE